ncbi:hypothetical protein [Amycolatopsis sp. NPDC098790]|uniref:hypothetical protein n=1 Tax=Amycolatopsis sp. NPDC098790 TaxID=3363939 RepID=UPI0038037C83
MSTLRRLAFAGAFALPISLAIVVPSSAGTLDGPYESWTPWSFESSGSYAGIGGAGTYEAEGGSDWWGHDWSEEEGTFAGAGGAGVFHNGHSGTTHDWDDDSDDDDNGWTGHWTGHHDGDAHTTTHHYVAPQPDPVDTADHVVYTQPVVDTDDDDDADYVNEVHSAGVNGATSAHIASHAGDDYATYESGNLTAGPGGASSEGVHSLAVPGYAAYHNWYTAAGAGGTAVHSVHAVADADDWAGDDHDWTDNDEDYDNGYDED